MADPDAVAVAVLARLRADTVARLADLRTEVADVIASASSTTGDDEHDPEGATIGFERAQAQALTDAATAQLREIDAARERIDAGTYGRCVTCHVPIGAERLEARPATPHCIRHADGARRAPGQRRGADRGDRLPGVC